MKRTDALNLIEAALAAGEAAYARRAAQRYLADWPGDLEAQALLARAAAREGDSALALQTLEALTQSDPEDYAAQRLMGELLAASGRREFAAHAFACAHIGDGRGAPAGFTLPAWVEHARLASQAARTGDWETALGHSQAALTADTPAPLPSLIHLAALWASGQMALALPLAQGFHARWPRVIVFRLCLAECLLARGENVRALELLHDAAGQDLTGRVATRHWGKEHPFQMLWDASPAGLSGLPGPLPPALVQSLGLNRLAAARPRQAPRQPSAATRAAQEAGAKGERQPAAQPASGPGAPAGQASSPAEEIADIRAQLEALSSQISAKSGAAPAAPGRYILLSSHTHLLQQYGQEGFAAVDQLIHLLGLSASARTGMPSLVVYADDPASLKALDLRPVNPGNAWDVKTLVGQIVARLEAQGESLGALLIVGGDEIIPFHRLPNPTDDIDADIPSDNPYAARDENYFVPEWPVGRLPSGGGRSPAPLLRALRIAAGARPSGKLGAGAIPWLARLWRWLLGRDAAGFGSRSFGYSANVWREASRAVFNSIGHPRDLLTSPPVDASALPAEGLAPSRLSYFNLHGIEDGPEWFGQRSADDPGSVPEYPVALRPADVVNSGRAPLVVFSEACYGANILGKSPEDALCLRFLDSGSRAVVASTKIAYGSVSTPLIGADLLGWYFWQNVNDGLPVGEALRRAKLQMAREMHARQGFLDGEDQKTLISFVLYGDPTLAAAGSAPRRSAKRWTPKSAAPLPTVCDRAGDSGQLSSEAVARIKSVVAEYLPGMSGAEWRVAPVHAHCQAVDHVCPTRQLEGAKSLPHLASDPHRTVVTLSKTVKTSARAHPHFARLTFDERGHVVKMAISR